MNSANIQDALNATSEFMFSKAQQLSYLNEEIARMDYEVEKEAHLRDLQKSREDGIQQGRVETQLSIAKKALDIDLQTIAQVSGLSLEELEKLG